MSNNPVNYVDPRGLWPGLPDGPDLTPEFVDDIVDDVVEDVVSPFEEVLEGELWEAFADLPGLVSYIDAIPVSGYVVDLSAGLLTQITLTLSGCNNWQFVGGTALNVLNVGIGTGSLMYFASAGAASGGTGLLILGGVAIAEFGLTYAVGEILDHCGSDTAHAEPVGKE